MFSSREPGYHRARPALSRSMNRVLDVAGTAYERGLAQGRRFPQAIAASVESLLQLKLAPAWLPRAAQRAVVHTAVAAGGLFYWQRHRALLSRHEGGKHSDMLCGLAAGHSVAPWRIYGFNAFEIESGLLTYRLGCTALGFSAEQTARGEPLLAYNHDFPPSFTSHLIVRRCQPLDVHGAAAGYRSVALSYSLLAGALAGVNERGLAICTNQAFCTDLSRWRAALCVSMLVQDCLEHCADLGAAIARIECTPVSAGALISLVDAHNQRAVVEVSGRATKLRQPKRDEVLWSVNHYRTAEMRSREIPFGAVTTGLAPGYDIHECNVTRSRRLTELLGKKAVYSDGQIQGILADHDDGCGDGNTICCHGDHMNQTICSAIIAPQTRAIDLLWGKPCCETLQRVLLA